MGRWLAALLFYRKVNNMPKISKIFGMFPDTLKREAHPMRDIALHIRRIVSQAEMLSDFYSVEVSVVIRTHEGQRSEFIKGQSQRKSLDSCGINNAHDKMSFPKIWL
jgi:hypothetical protein